MNRPRRVPRRPRRRGAVTSRSLLIVAGAASLGVLAACSPSGTACTTIGWFNEVSVQFDGESSPVASVELCVDGDCAPPGQGHPSPDATLAPPETQEWVFTTNMSTPDVLTVRAYRPDGTILAEEHVQPEWVRVGGTEECGGPHLATVTVEL
ncbi:hypothetical protein D9V41_10495 [Aeromicrobium phragmitis]|uniref:Uncharacterized protein n=1 Tax=Aeromicrobium phragmitis TaxID=2478914 RepID=A0A3L8PLB7_9ACTN|nr:hypothetical protein [Aeromicrobium phragmitis]RLV55513.1 hypothetical protein D9V41_10495 [Aeromicrobium phragmitis]